MTAINRPTDVLLNSEALKTSQSRREQSTLTDSNDRKNSFNELLSAKQKEASARDNKTPETSRPEGKREVKSASEESTSETLPAKTKTEASGKAAVAGGNRLPPEQSEAAELKAKEFNPSQEKMNIKLEPLIEGQPLAASTSVLPESKSLLEPSDGGAEDISLLENALNSKDQLAPEHSTAAENSPLLAVVDINNGDLTLEDAAVKADGMREESVAGAEASLLAPINPAAVAGNQVGLENDSNLTSETPEVVPGEGINVELDAADKNAVLDQNVLAAGSSDAVALATVAASVAAPLTAQDQVKQASAPLTQRLDESVQLPPLGNDGSIKEAKKIDLNITGELKPELTTQSSARQLPFGFELKQWLSEARRGVDPVVAQLPSVTDKDPALATDALTPARLHSLTQAIQGLSGAGLNAAPRATMAVNIQPPVDSAAWSQVVAQRITWLAGNGIRAAELQLNPQELGPVEVKIRVNNEQTSIHFTSQHASVRDALELSVQRLRDMLESNGLGLVDVNVSDQSGSQERESTSESSQPNFVAEFAQDQGAEATLVRVAETNSLVDYYV